VGLIVGIWQFDKTQSDLPADEISAIAAIGGRLQAATGLRVEHDGDQDRWLSIPTLGSEALFGWEFIDHTVRVFSFIPAHPYLWENLDAVMTTSGGRLNTSDIGWRPDPAYARLRTRWSSLPARDRFLLAMPSFLGFRPLDRLVS
jgi:hypothetical protein